ncbi:MAG: type II secretion system F family protein [Hymenobacter sp.]
MAEYTYKARDAAGTLKTGAIQASSEANAAELLAEHHLILTHLTAKKEGGLDASNLLNVLSRVGMKDRVVFTRQLGTMIKSGLTIVQALHILSEQTKNKKFQGIINDLSASIESGTNFSTALAKYPKLFDRVYINLVPLRRSRPATSRKSWNVWPPSKKRTTNWYARCAGR